MDDLISRQALYEILDEYDEGKIYWGEAEDRIGNLPSEQPELIEKEAYIRGFEQGRTQGMIDSQGTDCISRQDAIDEIEMLMERSEYDEHDKTWNNAIRGSINAIKHHVPSAQLFTNEEIQKMQDLEFAEIDKAYETGLREGRKKGNWVGIDDEPCETFECDVCGFTLEDWIQGVFYNFCPNCGADMRKPKLQYGDEDTLQGGLMSAT